MGRERGGESQQGGSRNDLQEEGRPNRREFLAGSVGALAASRMKNLNAFSSLPREGAAHGESAYGGGAAPRDH